MQQRTPAQRIPPAQLIGERGREHGGDLGLVPREHGSGPASVCGSGALGRALRARRGNLGLKRNRLRERLQRVLVDIGVMEAALLDAAQRLELGEHDGGRAQLSQQL